MLNEIPLTRIFECSDISFVNRFLRAMHHEMANHSSPDNVIMANLIEILLRCVQRESKGGGTADTVPSQWRAVYNRIHNDFSGRLTAKELSREMGISLSKFFADYRTHFFSSPIEDRIKAQLTQANYLMHNRNLTIAEISYAVGIDNPAYFSRLMKKHFGMGPRELRKYAL